MSRVMLFKPAGRPTGRLIGQGLGISFGTCAFHTRTKRERWEVAIRWGGTEHPERDIPNTLNPASAISRSGKITTFRLLADAGVPAPRWTTNPRVAVEWGTTYLGRTTADRGGRGITIYRPGEVCGRHPLYVELVPDCREYRLHVVRGEIVSLQRKYLERPHLDNLGGVIKNHDRGYVFKTPEKDLNESRKRAAISAVQALGLDFGAVDLVVDQDGKEYVLEVNTAPALSPMRVEHYLAALRPLLGR